jgi:hypothetical protein
MTVSPRSIRAPSGLLIEFEVDSRSAFPTDVAFLWRVCMGARSAYHPKRWLPALRAVSLDRLHTYVCSFLRCQPADLLLGAPSVAIGGEVIFTHPCAFSTENH